MNSKLLLLIFAIPLLLVGCGGTKQPEASLDTADHSAITSSLDADDEDLDETFATQLIPDPLEGWNRAMFRINDGLITYVGQPVNTAYTTVTPALFRQGLGNFFTNLMFPLRFANSLLQGKVNQAGQEFGKFLLNTSVGFGGLIDFAQRNHPELASTDNEDFGQTLAVWGVGEGFYLYWPVVGPSSLRDSAGIVVDWTIDPLSWMLPWWGEWVVQGTRAINDLDTTLATYDMFTKNAIEPYTAVRDAYTQYRRARITK